ncbi:(R)-phenoxypropionate/alpha-ketoglutarate-dioxygenase [BD1-7 clade bacterium]|uniref:(R)-phenoxypropionate/alpha-ketoglutarate-dioxygenase n=1 Tax=BD1-7 clade bacterium TaxID=2029982 RepID=A0A5S9QNI2_9GAMM|nr:(R)-phenoxypropionate/alpha-ketoglutarate-dioxygenase [BD1-7 clade bacterium]CAA0120706.1 (R)-phenoxypropionate/alpha-ketoglutarate-dioxygenase [BD1-7 clade bacterium]
MNSDASDFKNIDVAPCGPALGARVTSVVLSERLSDDCIQEILSAFYQYKVLFFEHQAIDDQQFVCFAEQVGNVQPDHYFCPIDPSHKVVEVRKEPKNEKNIGGRWHTDRAFEVNPPAATLLHAKTLPSLGGDTMFADMSSAFKRHSRGLQKVLCGLNAVHSNMDLANAREQLASEFNGRLMTDFEILRHEQPLVIQHPITGEPTLFANVISTEQISGWTDDESRCLLEYLYQHAVMPESTIRYQWQPNTVALWDNLATWHYALNDYPLETRVMHRITLAGTKLVRYQV